MTSGTVGAMMPLRRSIVDSRVHLRGQVWHTGSAKTQRLVMCTGTPVEYVLQGLGLKWKSPPTMVEEIPANGL